MKDLCEYYKMYRDLMGFWHSKYPGKIYDLNYERLTEDQETETRKLISYLNLNWEGKCLDFHKKTVSKNGFQCSGAGKNVHKQFTEMATF